MAHGLFLCYTCENCQLETHSNGGGWKVNVIFRFHVSFPWCIHVCHFCLFARRFFLFQPCFLGCFQQPQPQPAVIWHFYRPFNHVHLPKFHLKPTRSNAATTAAPRFFQPKQQGGFVECHKSHIGPRNFE